MYRKMDWKFPIICGGKSIVNVANSLTEVINFKRLVDNFRISFCPDTGVIRQDIHLYQDQDQAYINRVTTFTATGLSAEYYQGKF